MTMHVQHISAEPAGEPALASGVELVSHHLCPYVQRAAILLDEKGVPFTRTNIDLASKPDWFKAISPLGKVPLLKVSGAVLFESNVIIDYLDEATPGNLHPDNVLRKAQHKGWIEYASSMLDAIGGFYNAPDAEAFEAKRQVLVARFALLEQHLNAEGPFFEGAHFHLVDAVYGPVFRYFDVFDRIADFGVFADAPRLRRWRAALAARPSVRDAVAPDYRERLMDFLRARKSHLSTLIGPDLW